MTADGERWAAIRLPWDSWAWEGRTMWNDGGDDYKSVEDRLDRLDHMFQSMADSSTIDWYNMIHIGCVVVSAIALVVIAIRV